MKSRHNFQFKVEFGWKQMEKSQSLEDERWKEDGDRRRQTGTGRVW